MCLTRALDADCLIWSCCVMWFFKIKGHPKMTYFVVFWSGKRDSTQQSSITSLSDTYFVARVVSVANIEIHCQSYNTTFHLIINISAQNTMFYFRSEVLVPEIIFDGIF